MLTICGLGLYRTQLTLEAVACLRAGDPILLRTGRCAAASYLAEAGIAFETLDSCYEQAEDFDALHALLADAVEARAARGSLVYGVLDLRDESVGLLLARGIPAKLLPGVPTEGALSARACAPTISAAALDAESFMPSSAMNALIRELDTRTAASEMKLKLLTRYPAEAPVYLSNGEQIELCALDRLPDALYDHRLCALVAATPDMRSLERFGFADLMRIAHRLRAPGGCPWDAVQTHESLRHNAVEEAWEVADAIASGDDFALCDELGDLLLQIALHAEIAREHGAFSIDDVTSAICQKLIRRHPHVFAGACADSPDAVGALWEQVKRQETGAKTLREALDGIGRHLPALVRAEKALTKMRAAQIVPTCSDDPGGALLSMVQRCVEAGISPETALSDAIDRAISQVPAVGGASLGKPQI